MLRQFRYVSVLLSLLGPSVMMANAVPNYNYDVQVVQQKNGCMGIVKDAKGETVIGASVKVKGTKVGTITNVDGEFSLGNVKPGAMIQVSFVGYMTQDVLWNGGTLKITLKDDSKTLDEVVVTALGITKQARSVGYATTRVSTDEIARANVVNPIAALQGKVAGVNINVGGASGVTSSSSIVIRGAKSLSKNNSPIFVIDGMILEENTTNPLGGTDWGSQLKNLNSADYESVNVLKGAAATSLYGSRGANGAIVIVTKSGRLGKQGIGVEVSQSVDLTDVYKSPIALQNLYGAGQAWNGFEGGLLADGSLQKARVSFGPKMDGRLINQYLPGGKPTPYVAHPDNWKDLFQTGVNSVTNVAVSGGNEKSSFRLSYSYNDKNGVFARNNFNRHSISFKGVTELNKIFSLEAGMNYGFSTAQNGANQGAWNWGGNASMMTTYYMPRNMDVKTYVGMYRDPVTHAVESETPWGDLRGFLHNRDMNLTQHSESSLLANATLKAKIAPWLDASIKANYDYYGTSDMSKVYGTGVDYGPSGSGAYSRGGSTSGKYNFLGMLQSAGHKINLFGEKIGFDAIVAAELYGNTESHNWSKSTRDGLVTPGVFSFSNSKSKIEPQFGYTPANNQVFGVSSILNFSWKEQLYLELTARNDWMSTLAYPSYMIQGQNNYSVFYPSANLSWVFSETFKLPEWFSFGKFRASLARVGLGVNPYDTSKGYGLNQGIEYDPSRNSVLSASYDLGTFANYTVKPEIQQSIELGTDLRFFDERLTLDLAYYKTNTYNQAIQLGGVKETGASNQLINAGNIQNQGLEIQFEGTPIKTKDIRWTLGTNFTLNRGKVIKLNDYVKEWQMMWAYDGGPEIWAYEKGDFGVITTPYGSSTGGAIYRFNNPKDPSDSRNGKPVIKYAEALGDPNPVYAYSYVQNNDKGIKERKVIGKVEPDFLLSFNTTFSYKNFDLYAMIDGRVGGNFYSNSYKYASSRGTLLSSLNGRDKEHGGLARVNYKGETVYDAINLDAVFDENTTAPSANNPKDMIDVSGLTYQQALQKGIKPMMASTYYNYNLGWGMPSELGIQDNTWFCFRELTLGYRFPEKICRKFGANFLRLGFTARNLGYLVNKLKDDLNPESISNNNPLTPMDIGGVPYSRSFTFNLTVRF